MMMMMMIMMKAMMMVMKAMMTGHQVDIEGIQPCGLKDKPSSLQPGPALGMPCCFEGAR